MYRKNVAGQYVYFALVNATTGAALTGATVTGKRGLDGAAQASVTGTITEDAGGQYHLALSQADTNANNIGLLFTATNAIPVSLSIVTTAADPTDSVRFGLTALPNAAAGASSGLPLAVDSSGRVDVLKVNGTSQTARDLGASVLLSSGTGTGQLDFTSGVVKSNLAQILGTALTETAGLIAAAFKQFFNIASPTSTMNTITAVTTAANLTTNNDKTNYALAALDSAPLESGTAQAGAASTITLRSGASAVNSFYRGQGIEIYGGTGAGQARVISAYVGSTKVATVDEAWSTNPDSTSTYRVKHRSPSQTGGSVTATISVVNAPSDSSGVTTLLANVGTPAGASVSADIAAVKVDTAAVKVQTDKLAFTVTNQVDVNVLDWKSATAPAMTGDAFARLGAPAGASVSVDVAAVKSDSAAIKAKTDNLPSSPAAVGSAMTLTSAYDPAKTAAQAGDAMALTSGERTSLAAVIWAALTSALTTASSIGKLLVDNINATISSRSTYAGGAVASVTAGVTVTTNNDKTGYALTAGEHTSIAADAQTGLTAQGYTSTRAGYLDTLNGLVQAVWDKATSALTTAGSIGKWVLDKLDVVLSTRSATGAQMDLVNAPNATAVTAIQSGLATSAALATAKTELDAVKAKTDLIPTAPAAVSDIPTATQNADALLKRDMSAVSGESARSPINALRVLRNKVTISGTTLTVTKEDDSTAAWTGVVSTDAAADPIVGVDPS